MIKVEEIGSGREAFESARLGDRAGGRFRLDSGGESKWARWSYRVGPPSMQLICNSSGETLLITPASVRRWQNPLEALQWLSGTLDEPTREGPPFQGGWIGYFSYDLVRFFEQLPAKALDDLHWPLFCLTWHDTVLSHDGCTGRNLLCAQNLQRQPALELAKISPNQESTRLWTFTEDEYQRAVRRSLDFISAGDVFQVNLSQRFCLPRQLPPASLYQRMRGRYAADFGALLDYGDHALISNSPELFVRVNADRKIITRPIKGTRPRGEGMERQLLESKKDQAELNMIVDLERNDLGRICEIGSVKVTNPREIEAHPTVYHGVATIEGQLRKDVGLVELLRATFPGGSVTGAPKIRAMEIIDELEPVRRGPYCGAIGYLSADGQMQFNIAIRTIVVNGGKAYVSVGGGIVADSNPKDEYEETLIKAKAMFDVLGVNESMIQ